MDEFDQTQAIFIEDEDFDDVTDEIDPDEERKPAGFLKVLHQKGLNETIHSLYEGDNIIGRSTDSCHVCIPSKSLSKEHACIQIQGQNHLIFDKGSRNKTKRGKMFLTPEVRYEIREGDELSFADVKCVYLGQKEPIADSGSETDESLLLHPENGIDSTMEIEPAGRTPSAASKKTDAHERSDVMVQDTPEEKQKKNHSKGAAAPVQTLVLSESENEEDETTAGAAVQDTLLCDDTDPEASMDQEVFVAATQAYFPKKPTPVSDDEEPSDLLGAATQFFGKEIEAEEEEEILTAATQAFVQAYASMSEQKKSSLKNQSSSQPAGTQSFHGTGKENKEDGTQSFDDVQNKKSSDSFDSSTRATQVFDDDDDNEEEEGEVQRLFAMSTLAVDTDEVIGDSEGEDGDVSEEPTQVFSLDLDQPTQKFPSGDRDGESETVSLDAAATIAISESIKKNKKDGKVAAFQDKNQNDVGEKVSAESISGTVPIVGNTTTVAIDETIALGETQPVIAETQRKSVRGKRKIQPATITDTVVITEDDDVGTVAVKETVAVDATLPVKEIVSEKKQKHGTGVNFGPSGVQTQTLVISEEEEEEEEEEGKTRGKGQTQRGGGSPHTNSRLEEDNQRTNRRGRNQTKGAVGQTTDTVPVTLTETIVLEEDEESRDGAEAPTQVFEEMDKETEVVNNVVKTNKAGKPGSTRSSQIEISDDSDDDDVEPPWKTGGKFEEATQAYGLGDGGENIAQFGEATQAYGLEDGDDESNDDVADPCEPTQAYGLQEEEQTQAYGIAKEKKKQSLSTKRQTRKTERNLVSECEPTVVYDIDVEKGAEKKKDEEVVAESDEEATQQFDQDVVEDEEAEATQAVGVNEPTQKYDMVNGDDPTQKYDMEVDGGDDETKTATTEKSADAPEPMEIELESDSEDESMLRTDNVAAEEHTEFVPDTLVDDDNVKKQDAIPLPARSPLKSALADRRRSPSPARKKVAFVEGSESEEKTEAVSSSRATRASMSPRKEPCTSPKKSKSSPSPTKQHIPPTASSPLRTTGTRKGLARSRASGVNRDTEGSPESVDSVQNQPNEESKEKEREAETNEGSVRGARRGRGRKSAADKVKEEETEGKEKDTASKEIGTSDEKNDNVQNQPNEESKEKELEAETNEGSVRGARRGRGRKSAADMVKEEETEGKEKDTASKEIGTSDEKNATEENPEDQKTKTVTVRSGKRGRKGKAGKNEVESSPDRKKKESAEEEKAKDENDNGEEAPVQEKVIAKGRRGRGRGQAANKPGSDAPTVNNEKVSKNTQSELVEHKTEGAEIVSKEGENVEGTDLNSVGEKNDVSEKTRKAQQGKRKVEENPEMPSPSTAGPTGQKKSRKSRAAAQKVKIDEDLDNDSDETASMASSVDSKDTESTPVEQSKSTRRGRQAKQGHNKTTDNATCETESPQTTGSRMSSRGRRISNNPYLKDFETSVGKGKNKRDSSISSDQAKHDSSATDPEHSDKDKHTEKSQGRVVSRGRKAKTSQKETKDNEEEVNEIKGRAGSRVKKDETTTQQEEVKVDPGKEEKEESERKGRPVGRGRRGQTKSQEEDKEEEVQGEDEAEKEDNEEKGRATGRGRRGKATQNETKPEVDEEKEVKKDEKLKNATRGRGKQKGKHAKEQKEEDVPCNEDDNTDSMETDTQHSKTTERPGKRKAAQNKAVDDLNSPMTTDTPQTPVRGRRNTKLEASQSTEASSQAESVSTQTPKSRRSATGAAKVSNASQSQGTELSSQPESISSQTQTRRGRRGQANSTTDSQMEMEKEAESPVAQRGGRKRKMTGQDTQHEPTTPTPSKNSRRSQPNTPSTKQASPKTAAVHSPSLRKSTLDNRPKVMFTGVIDEQGEKIVKDLGGELASTIHECTHLITDKVRRTVKFLAGLAKGALIVSPLWLTSSKQAGTFIEGHKFLVSDTAMEKQYKFTLSSSIHKASQKTLLEGYRIYVTPSVKPDPIQMQDILECAGAQFLKSLPTKEHESTIVISCEADEKVCQPALKVNIPVVGVEFVLTGILRQELNIELHRLFQSDASSQGSTRGRGKKK